MNFSFLNLFLKETKSEFDYRWNTKVAFLKDDVDLRIESLKTQLDDLRDEMHKEIDNQFKDLMYFIFYLDLISSFNFVFYLQVLILEFLLLTWYQPREDSKN